MAQEGNSQDTTNLEIGSTEWLSAHELAIGLYTYTIIPAFAALGVASVASPTYYAEFEGGRVYHGVSFGSGVGIGFGDTTGYYPELFFSSIRLQGEYAYFGEHPTARERATGTFMLDWNALPVLRKNIFRLGMGIGSGLTLSQDLPRYHVQGEIWIKNAMGLRYIGLMPEHTLFLRGRWNLRNQVHLSSFSVALGYASTFSFLAP